MGATQQRAVTDSVPELAPSFLLGRSACESSYCPVRKEPQPGAERLIVQDSEPRARRVRAIAERVDDGDGGEEDDEESGISLTFTVCQAPC